jgi:hypothetical protein
VAGWGKWVLRWWSLYFHLGWHLRFDFDLEVVFVVVGVVGVAGVPT